METVGLVSQLLREHGRTYAEEAGIILRDKPSPLYQLLVLAVLCSTRIKADIAVNAAVELFRAHLRSTRSMGASDWQAIVDALGRAHYRRYDESTATALLDGVRLLDRRWHGDLRRLRREAGGDAERIWRLLQEVPRIGPVGADIFCREAQGIWPELRPFFGARALESAVALGLPASARVLGDLVPPEDLPRLAAALVRADLQHWTPEGAVRPFDGVDGSPAQLRRLDPDSQIPLAACPWRRHIPLPEVSQGDPVVVGQPGISVRSHHS
jgi:hypothetical protein